MRQGQQRSRCDWAGGTPPPLLLRCHLPGVRRFTCKNSLPPPLFLSSVFTVSPLLLHHASSTPTPFASLFLSLLSLLPYLTPHPSTHPPPVLLCLSSSCIASPAPWCGTGNQNSAHIHTCARRLAHTHTHRHARGGTHERTSHTHRETHAHNFR